jgi:hypothetical protein
MTEISQQEVNRQKNKIAVALTVQEASAKVTCSNCFMACGLRHAAGATVLKHNKVFCDNKCLMEWEDNQDEYA